MSENTNNGATGENLMIYTVHKRNGETVSITIAYTTLAYNILSYSKK